MSTPEVQDWSERPRVILVPTTGKKRATRLLALHPVKFESARYQPYGLSSAPPPQDPSQDDLVCLRRVIEENAANANPPPLPKRGFSNITDGGENKDPHDSEKPVPIAKMDTPPLILRSLKRVMHYAGYYMGLLETLQPNQYAVMTDKPATMVQEGTKRRRVVMPGTFDPFDPAESREATPERSPPRPPSPEAIARRQREITRRHEKEEKLRARYTRSKRRTQGVERDTEMENITDDELEEYGPDHTLRSRNVHLVPQWEARERGATHPLVPYQVSSAGSTDGESVTAAMPPEHPGHFRRSICVDVALNLLPHCREYVRTRRLLKEKCQEAGQPFDSSILTSHNRPRYGSLRTKIGKITKSTLSHVTHFSRSDSKKEGNQCRRPTKRLVVQLSSFFTDLPVSQSTRSGSEAGPVYLSPESATIRSAQENRQTVEADAVLGRHQQARLLAGTTTATEQTQLETAESDEDLMPELETAPEPMPDLRASPSTQSLTVENPVTVTARVSTPAPARPQATGTTALTTSAAQDQAPATAAVSTPLPAELQAAVSTEYPPLPPVTPVMRPELSISRDMEDLPDAPPIRSVHWQENAFPLVGPIEHVRLFEQAKAPNQLASPFGRESFQQMQARAMFMQSPALSVNATPGGQNTPSRRMPYFGAAATDAADTADTTNATDESAGVDPPPEPQLDITQISYRFNQFRVSDDADFLRNDDARYQTWKTGKQDHVDKEKREQEEKARKIAERKKRREEEKLKQEEEERKRLAAERERNTSIIQPLSKQAIRKYRGAMNKDDASKVLTPETVKMPMTRRDLGTVIPQGPADGNGWLNDQSVNSYIWAAVARLLELDQHQADQTPRVYAFSTFLYTTFQAKGFEGVKRWAKRGKVDGKRLLDVETAVIPINSGAHWTLVVVSGTGRTIKFYDSLSGSGQTYLDFAKAYIKGVLGDDFVESEWTITQEPSVQQRNSLDCGVFVCMNALAALSGRVPSEAFKAEEMLLARQRIVATLIHGGFYGEFDF